MIQDLAWATVYNLSSVPLAAGVVAFAGIILAAAVGAILMSVLTIAVAANTQLLRRINLRLSSSDEPHVLTAPGSNASPRGA